MWKVMAALSLVCAVSACSPDDDPVIGSNNDNEDSGMQGDMGSSSGDTGGSDDTGTTGSDMGPGDMGTTDPDMGTDDVGTDGGGDAGTREPSPPHCRATFETDGVVTRISTVERDAEGRPLRAEVDEGGDGTIDTVTTKVYEPIAGGERITTETDNGVDDVIDTRLIRDYDDQGRLVRDENFRNGARTLLLTITYEADRTIWEWDNDNDNVIDRRRTVTYDANERVTKVEDDTDADGTIDNLSTTTWVGNVGTTQEDVGNDNVIDSIEVVEFDSDGRRIRREVDGDADGTIDYRETGTWTTDANGHVTLVSEYDNDADGTVDERETFQWDELGQELYEEYDTNADGTRDAWTDTTYDMDGKLISTERHLEDGTVFTTTYEYDCN